MESVRTVYILAGPSQSGKTQSIKLLSRMVPKDDLVLVFRSKKWIECLEVIDFKGVRIGITSRSDKFPLFRDNFRFLAEEMGCSIVVTAANEKTKGVESFLEDIQNEGWQLKVVQKYPQYCNRSSKDIQLTLNLNAAKAVWDLVLEDIQAISSELT